jgi:hypothetical protein
VTSPLTEVESLWESSNRGVSASQPGSMWGAMSSLRRVVASGSVVVLAVVLAGLGATSAGAGQSVSSASLARYVVQAGEETGYSPSGAPTLIRSAAAWATGDPNAPTDAKRLRGEGFRAALTQQTTGSNSTGGPPFVQRCCDMDVEVGVDPSGDRARDSGHRHLFLSLGVGDTAQPERWTGQRRACEGRLL